MAARAGPLPVAIRRTIRAVLAEQQAICPGPVLEATALEGVLVEASFLELEAFLEEVELGRSVIRATRTEAERARGAFTFIQRGSSHLEHLFPSR